MGLHFIISQKGKRQLLYNNYVYGEHTRSSKAVNWRCIYYKSEKCNAKIKTDSDKKCGKVLCVRGDHHHIIEKSEVEALKVKAKIKKDAAKSSETPINIISKATAVISKTTSAILPQNKSLCRTVQRERFKVLGAVALPEDALKLEMPEMYLKTLRGEKFLQFDYVDDYNRILLFTTASNLKILKKCAIWQGDGTFDTVPSIFKQLYTIHGRYMDITMPLVYVLTTDKSKATYSKILNRLLGLKPGLNPLSFIVDFELAVIRALEESFPDIDIHGCFFHFTECIWRCVQSNGLQIKYASDEEFSLEVRKLIALAFVPVEDVVYSFDALVASDYYVENKELFAPIIQYFEPNWVIKRGKRSKTPRFPHGLWNCYMSVINNSPKTNNDIEGWHRGFSSKLNISHASVWKFCNTIQLEQSLTENKISDIAAQKIVKTRKRKIVEFENRLSRIVSSYNREDVLDYLDAIAVNVVLYNVNKRSKV